jgi:hypothetical protein
MTPDLDLVASRTRRLEGAGSASRLRALQRRFIDLGRKMERARRQPAWRLPLLCAVMFLCVLVGGMVISATLFGS